MAEGSGKLHIDTTTICYARTKEELVADLVRTKALLEAAVADRACFWSLIRRMRMLVHDGPTRRMK